MSMEFMFANLAKAVLGEDGAKKLTQTAEGIGNGVKAIVENQNKLLLQQENIFDRIGRIERALNIPLSDAPESDKPMGVKQ